MGLRGPVAKRSTERIGKSMGVRDTRNKLTTIEHDFNVVIPTEDDNWHDFAKWWYRSLRKSGQSKFYENSDWMTAYIAADLLDVMMKGGYRSGLLAEWNDMSSRLMSTESDRRRVHVELVNKGVDPEDVAAEADVEEWENTLTGEIVG